MLAPLVLPRLLARN